MLGDPQEDPAEVNYDATRGRSHTHTQTQNNSFNFAVNENPEVENTFVEECTDSHGQCIGVFLPRKCLPGSDEILVPKWWKSMKTTVVDYLVRRLHVASLQLKCGVEHLMSCRVDKVGIVLIITTRSGKCCKVVLGMRDMSAIILSLL